MSVAPKKPIGEKNAGAAGSLKDYRFELMENNSNRSCKWSWKTTVEEVKDEGDAPLHSGWNTMDSENERDQDRDED